MQDKPKN
jgi:hypothetical protein